MSILKIKALAKAHHIAAQFREIKKWQPGNISALHEKPKAKGGGSAASLYIYQVIGFDWWTGEGVTADDVAKALDAVKGAKTLDVYINSEGGDVMQAKAIYSNLKRFDAVKTVHIDGIAASAATLVMLAGDEVRVSPVATIMIHEAWGGAVGDSAELRAYADVLDLQNSDLAQLYAKKTGKTDAEMRTMMADETWMNAQQALDLKLVDSIESDDDEEDDDGKDDAKAFGGAGVAKIAAAARRTQDAITANSAAVLEFKAAIMKAKTEALTNPGKPGNQRTAVKTAGAPTKQQ